MDNWPVILLGGAFGYAFYQTQLKSSNDGDIYLAQQVAQNRQEIARLAAEWRKTGIPAKHRLGDNEYLPQFPTQTRKNDVALSTGDAYIDAAMVEAELQRVFYEQLIKHPKPTPFYVPSTTTKVPVLITTLSEEFDGLDPNYIYREQTGLKKKLGRTSDKY